MEKLKEAIEIINELELVGVAMGIEPLHGYDVDFANVNADLTTIAYALGNCGFETPEIHQKAEALIKRVQNFNSKK